MQTGLQNLSDYLWVIVVGDISVLLVGKNDSEGIVTISVRIDAPAPIDCLQGERDRRFFSDPYFPELDR